MTRIFRLVLCLMVLLVLTSCGSRRELNELGIVIASGLDGNPGKYRITTQMIVPSALYSGSGGSTGLSSGLGVYVFTSEGKTIQEAVERSTLKNPRQLYLSHNSVLVIGKEAANEGITELLDRYFRNLDSRETVKVLVADNTAEEILTTLVPPEKLPGKALDQILNKEQKWESIYHTITVYEMALKFTSQSGAAGVPQIRLEGTNPEIMKSSDAFKQTTSPAHLVLSGLCLFQNGRRVGSLTEQESLGVTWLMNKVKRHPLSFVNREEGGDKKSLSAYLVKSAKVKVAPVKTEEGYMLKVKASVKGELRESESVEDMEKTAVIKRMEEQIEREIASSIRQGWAALQKNRADVIGIADMLYRKDPKAWDSIKPEWKEQISKMNIDISVKVSIRRTGLIQSSFRRIQEKVMGEK